MIRIFIQKPLNASVVNNPRLSRTGSISDKEKQYYKVKQHLSDSATS
jgi:hypothetical protein